MGTRVARGISRGLTPGLRTRLSIVIRENRGASSRRARVKGKGFRTHLQLANLNLIRPKIPTMASIPQGMDLSKLNSICLQV